MSVGTAPLGLSEPLFYPSYWFPPTVLDLGEKTGFDFESIIFSFAVGGLASSLYGLFGNNKLLPVGECERHSRHHRYHKFLLSSPVWLFLGLEWLTSWNAIYTASWSLLGGAIATVLCRSDLLVSVIKGSFIHPNVKAFPFSSFHIHFNHCYVLCRSISFSHVTGPGHLMICGPELR